MHTRQNGLKYWWRIRLYRKHYVVVFMWESKEVLQEKCSCYGSCEETLGLAHSFGTTFDPHTAKVGIPRKFGEIHLVDGKYGAGLVAHEIQHIINYWIDKKGWNPSIYDEKLAMCAMRITTDFWKGHYTVTEMT